MNKQEKPCDHEWWNMGEGKWVDETAEHKDLSWCRHCGALMRVVKQPAMEIMLPKREQIPPASKDT